MTDDTNADTTVPHEKAAHELAVLLRNEGHTIGFDSSAVNDDFSEHVAHATDILENDDLGGFYLVALREGQTDFSSSIALSDPLAMAILQIEMLGSHFRSVHDSLPLDTSQLIEAMVDEALTIEEMDDDGPD